MKEKRKTQSGKKKTPGVDHVSHLSTYSCVHVTSIKSFAGGHSTTMSCLRVQAVPQD